MLLSGMPESKKARRPRRVLRIGVTGHRLDKLDADDAARLRAQVRKILLRLKQALVGHDPAPARGGAGNFKLQIVSPLAEGADRLVAEAALDEGAELIAPLPFPRERYALDFADPASRADFFALLGRAAQVVEIDGRRGSERSRQEAYRAVGTLVLRKSDMLIALWDGRKASGPGGTADVIDEAREAGRPVLWLPTAGARPRTPQLMLAERVVSAGAVGAFIKIAKDVAAARP